MNGLRLQEKHLLPFHKEPTGLYYLALETSPQTYPY